MSRGIQQLMREQADKERLEEEPGSRARSR
jgi:hypothetical protein